MYLNKFLDYDQFVHVARNVRQTGSTHGAPVHGHDFPEVFWLEAGECLHRINGQSYVLSRGDMVFIRPTDVHAIQMKRGRELRYVNLAFHKEHLDEFSGRLFADDPDFWGGRGEIPTTVRLSEGMLNELAVAVETLLLSPRSKLMMEWVLCEVFRIIGPASRFESGIPYWLQSALIRIRQPEHFRRGSTGLSTLAERTPEHVSRVTKQLLGKTPSQIVNEARIQYAASQLIMTDDDINTIALESGFLSLGQFYSVFKTAFSVTPRQYRLHHWRIN